MNGRATAIRPATGTSAVILTTPAGTHSSFRDMCCVVEPTAITPVSSPGVTGFVVKFNGHGINIEMVAPMSLSYVGVIRRSRDFRYVKRRWVLKTNRRSLCRNDGLISLRWSSGDLPAGLPGRFFQKKRSPFSSQVRLITMC